MGESMLGHRIFALMAGVAAVCSPARAQQAQRNPGSPIVVTGQEYNNKVVCRYEASTGSRFSSRVCHTNKEWNDIRENTLRAAHEFIDRPQIETCRDSPTNCGGGYVPKGR